METVDIVIRMPKSEYEELTRSGYTWWGKHGEYIKKGTVLPKNYGRLIDADDYLANTPIRKSADEVWIKETYVYDTITDAPTILEANKDGE